MGWALRNQEIDLRVDFWSLAACYGGVFCVGDRFYLCENKILCEYDYEERLVFANMAYNPPSIAAIKRHLPPPVRAPRARECKFLAGVAGARNYVKLESEKICAVPSPSTGHIGMNHRNGGTNLHPSTSNGDGSTRLTNGYPPTSDHQIFEAK
ncbi:hypothetical protein RUM44_005022 [Polyplax serrata]|uniref:Uncharacterized protein n=1 Tax=Polyplax serrata TaxID=468196 RepID=A0ABR1AWU6_POLSC